MTTLASSYGVHDGKVGNQLTMVPQPTFSPLLYKRARIVDDYGGGNFGIPGVDEVVTPKQPRRRVRPRQEPMQEYPPFIPIHDELPMDPYNVELRAFQDEFVRSMNYGHRNFAHMMNHLNIPRMDDEPDYPYVGSWNERWNARKGGAGGSGLGGEESEYED